MKHNQEAGVVQPFDLETAIASLPVRKCALDILCLQLLREPAQVENTRDRGREACKRSHCKRRCWYGDLMGKGGGGGAICLRRRRPRQSRGTHGKNKEKRRVSRKRVEATRRVKDGCPESSLCSRSHLAFPRSLLWTPTTCLCRGSDRTTDSRRETSLKTLTMNADLQRRPLRTSSSLSSLAVISTPANRGRDLEL